MGKRKSAIEDVLDVAFEVSRLFWPVGAFFSVLFLVLSAKALSWVLEWRAAADSGNAMLQVFSNSWVGWLGFGLPAISFLIGIAFAGVAWRAYRETNRL